MRCALELTDLALLELPCLLNGGCDGIWGQGLLVGCQLVFLRLLLLLSQLGVGQQLHRNAVRVVQQELPQQGTKNVLTRR